MINTKVKALVNGELSVTNWKTYMSCNYVEGGNEYLRLGGCGLRGISGELKESQTTNKMANKLRVSERVATPQWAEVFMFL